MSALHPPSTAVREAVDRALAEDLGPLGDLTSSLLPLDVHCCADLTTRQEGVFAGRMCAVETFARVDPSIRVSWLVDDGDALGAGDVLGRVEGPLPAVLTAERTALNFLCHLSGIATLTRRFVRATHGKALIRDTRKTTPGLRALEKAAVRAGGGVNHRGNLSDGILVKDNHLFGLTVAEAVRRSRKLWPGRSIQVECDRIEQVSAALEAGAELILCDNMTPEEVTRCVELVEGRALVEVSGGVTLENVSSYADTGADLISLGAITHSAPALDIGLDLETGGE